MFEAELTPVCSPSLLGGAASDFSVDDLRKYAFLHDEVTKGAWRKWLDRAGIDDPTILSGPVIGDPNVRIQAVIDGQGFALMDWLVSDELESRRIVAPIGVKLAGYGYYLICQTDEMSVPASAFANWLRKEAEHAR